MIAPENYQVTEQTDGFTVAVNPEYVPALTPGGTLRFVYFMYLSRKADPTKGFKNEASVDNGHTGNQTPPTVEIVTGGKRFIKVDGDVTATQTLAGASSAVRDRNSGTISYLKIDETAKTAAWVKARAEATTFTTTADGLVDIAELEHDTCYLEETVAPGNYILLTNRIEPMVNGQSYDAIRNLVSSEKVPNKHKGTLPSTGGREICVYLGSDAVLLLAARVYFARRRKENAQFLALPKKFLEGQRGQNRSV